MWDRSMLKENAKMQLKLYYWPAFAVCLISVFLGGGSGNVSFNFGSGGAASRSSEVVSSGSGSVDAKFALTMLGILLVTFLTAMAIGLAVSAFLGGPIQVGTKAFFIQAPYGNRDIGTIFYAFRAGRYMAIVKTMFLTNLYIFLWSLLFVIPGIIKSYQYRFVPYIIAESPNLTPAQAMEISTQMTNGNKGEMFVLDLSFIGWNMLGALACGIGVLFVSPYVEATWAQLYFTLRSQYGSSQTQSAAY